MMGAAWLIWVFCLSAGWLSYVWIGYPLVLHDRRYR